MTWQLNVREQAKKDVRKAAQWYEQQQIRLGDEFAECIELAVANLQHNLHVYQTYYRKFRQLLPDRFPYRIFYLIDGNKVVVTRVLHAGQDFKNRLK